ncbi:MAG TPA: SDR family oxidoreductase [Patescibacteria group bacterium]|nr:SDR family oxidoreductase [Patescibacteria group bacterium]
MDIKNKVVLITGSSSGIGKATAIRFAEEGAKIVINYHINEKGGKETLNEIKKITPDVVLVKADVSKTEDVDNLFKETIDKFGTIDILINNAGIGTDKVPFMEAKHEDLSEMINTNLVGPMICSQKAIKIMEKQGFGKILNTTSIRGSEHGGRAPVYAATKAALNSFTKTLSKQVAPHIQVNAVAPGFVKTRSYDNMTQEMVDGFINQTYLKRWVTVDEIADAFVFLVKNDAMTGQVIYVDAGFTLK